MNERAPLMKALGILLEKRILETGYKSLYEFSQKNEKIVSSATINRIINNKQDIKLQTFIKICNVLKIRPESLLIDLRKEIDY